MIFLLPVSGQFSKDTVVTDLRTILKRRGERGGREIEKERGVGRDVRLNYCTIN